MSGAEVARVMGSPNVVTKDGDNSEVWIYDKISTTASASRSSLFESSTFFYNSSFSF